MVTAGAGLSSAPAGGAVARRGRTVRAAPLSGRGGAVDRRSRERPLRPLRWPGLSRRLTVRSAQHHGEAGQPGGEYLAGGTMGRRGARGRRAGSLSLPGGA